MSKPMARVEIIRALEFLGLTVQGNFCQDDCIINGKKIVELLNAQIANRKIKRLMIDGQIYYQMAGARGTSPER